MRKKRLRFLSAMLATVLAFPSANMTALAEEPDVGAESQEVVSVSHETVTDVEDEEHILNYRDIPGDDQVESISEYGDDYIPANRTNGDEIPKAWKGDEVAAYMPPLRNQSPFGSCWAHAALALAEISLRKKRKLTDSNLSEVQLAYFSYHWKEDPLGGTAGDKNEGVFGNDNYLGIGGSLDLAQNVLASWTGASDDAGDLAYPHREEDLKETLDDSYAYDDIAHLQNYYHVSIDPGNGINSPDMQAAKKLIKENGALGISFFAESSMSNAVNGNIYNKTTNAYYDPEDHNFTNHSVVVVGWDDEFPVENFSSEPKPHGPGAWLVRNSWTTGDFEHNQSYSGYFWMSYYNPSLAKKAYAFDFTESNNYDNNYQYDGAAVTDTRTYHQDKISGANIFQAKSTGDGEVLKAVSFYTPNTNVNYTVNIYRNLSDNTRPDNGTLLVTQTGMTTYAGYHTVPLDNAVSLEKNERFSVVVDLEKSGATDVAIGAEYSHTSTWHKITAAKKAGESFIKYGTQAWEDVVSKDCGNIRIKAFTDNGITTPVDLSTAAEGQITVRDAVYSGSELHPVVVVKDANGTIVNAAEYELSYSNNVNVGEGSVTITAKDGSTKCSGSITRSFHIGQADLASAVQYYKNPENGEETEIRGSSYFTTYNFYSLWTISRYYVFKNAGNTMLVEGTDYEPMDPEDKTYLDITPNEELVSFTYRGKGNYTGEKTVFVKLQPTDISSSKDQYYYSSKFDANKKYYQGAVVKDVADQTYNPHGVTPQLEVSNKSRGAMVKDTDYTVVFKDNDKVTDAATATITGIGNYTGSRTKTFKIVVADIKDAVLSGVTGQVFTEGGAPVTLSDLKVVYDGVELAAGTDYEVSYADNQAVGTAKVTVTGKGNYTGTKVETFDIMSSDTRTVISASDVTLAHGSFTYDGTPKTVEVTVKSGGTTLTEGTDYTLSTVFANGNINVGSGTVTITGKGNYKGTVEKPVTIVQADITNLTVDGVASERTYTGHAITQSGLSYKLGQVALPAGDFTLEYSDNVNAGTAKITVSGGNFSNSKIVEFTIAPADLSTASVTPAQKEIEYDKNQKTPEVTVTLEGFGDLTSSDYDVSYQNNTNAGTASITVSGKGNFKGSARGEFFITKRALQTGFVTLGTSEGLTYNGKSQIPTITVKDDEDTLTENTDYSVTVSDSVNAGTATITVSGMGNYYGNVERTYSIGRASVTVTAQNQSKKYGENDPDNFPVSISGLIEGEPESLIRYIVSRESGEDVGNYTITPAGDAVQGNYSASFVSGTFSIQKALYQGTKTASGFAWSGRVTENATLELPALPTEASYGNTDTVGGSAAFISSHSISGTTLTYSTTSQSNGTSATITIPVTGAKNYEDYSVVVTITARNKEDANAQITGGSREVTFGDSTITISGTVEKAGQNGSWTWSSQNTEVATISSDGAVTIQKTGSAVIKGVYESDTTYGEAEITLTVKMAPIQPALTLEDWSYGETAKTPVVTGNSGGGTVTCTYKVKNADDSTYSETVPTEPGEYTIKAVIGSTENYEGGTATADFKIKKAVSSVTTAPVLKTGMVYDGSLQELITAGVVSGGTLQYAVSQSSETAPADYLFAEDCPKKKEFGMYYVWYLVNGNDRYDGIAPVCLGSVKIEKKEITVSGISVKEKEYDGTTGAELDTDSITYDGKVGTDVLTFSASAAFADANAGDTKTVTLSNLTLGGEASENYKLAEEQTTTLSGKIKKKPVTVKAKDQTVALNESVVSVVAQAELTGALTGHELTAVTLTSGSTAAETTEGTITPSAAVIKDGDTVVTANYQITYEPGVLTVVKLPAAVKKAPQAKENLIYTGSAQALVTEGEAEDGTMAYLVTTENTEPAEGSAYAADIPKEVDAGTYYVWYKAAGNETHKDSAAASVSVKIEKGAQDAPAVDGFTVQKPGSIQAANGQIGNSTLQADKLEYKKKGDPEWTAVSAFPLTSLSTGTYLFRYKETKNLKAGTALSIVLEPDNFLSEVKISGSTVYQSGKTATLTAITNKNVTGLNLTYCWYRDGKAISGATAATYTLTAEDVGAIIKVSVKDTDGGNPVSAVLPQKITKVVQPSFEVSGKVTSSDGTAFIGADVELKKGDYVVAVTKTGDDGTYSFGQVPAGMYNLVVTEDVVNGRVKTVLAEIKNSNLTVADIRMPEKNVSSKISVVENEEENVLDTGATVVGGLDSVAEAAAAGSNAGDVTTVTMTVEGLKDLTSENTETLTQEQKETKEDQAAIKTAIQGNDQTKSLEKVDFLDLSIFKRIKTADVVKQDAITETNTVLEIRLAYQTTGRKNITVFRKHGDNAVEPLVRDSSQKTSGFVNGHFFQGEGFIIIYSSQFSTYAIGYSEEKKDLSSGGSSWVPPYVVATSKPSEEPDTSKDKEPGGSSGGGGGGASVTDEKKSTPVKPMAPMLESRTDTSITVKTVTGQVYSIDNGTNWQESGTFTGLAPDTEYRIITKVSATDKTNESAVSDALVVTTSKKENAQSTATPSTAPEDQASSSGQPDGAVSSDQPTSTVKPTSAPVGKVTSDEKKKAVISLNAGLKVVHQGQSVKVSWGKVNKAGSYRVYAGYYGKKISLVKTVKGDAKCTMTFKKLDGKKLSAKKNIQVYVAAYRKAKTKSSAKTVLANVRIAKSLTAYVTGKKNDLYTNAKAIKLSKTSYTIKKGKYVTIKAKTVLEDSKKTLISDVNVNEFRYASTNEKIAYVDGKGRIRAKKKGSCVIYVYAGNGLAKKIKVKVK